MNVSAKAFDIITSYFAPRLRSTVLDILDRPTALLDQKEGIKGKEYSKAYYEEDSTSYIVFDLVETYCGLQTLELPLESDLILARLKRFLYTAAQVASLSKRNITRYTWDHTHAEEPLRLFFFRCV